MRKIAMFTWIFDECREGQIPRQLAAGYLIRNETESDFNEVEELTRKAFWNVYVPGCVEHYLAHILRGHEDFVPELHFVAETEDGKVVGNLDAEEFDKQFPPMEKEVTMQAI
jgi:predicted N-acetyltransferase YhbS